MREPKLLIATGGKGVGKTYTTCKVIERYIRSDAKTGKEGRKVLIFDVNEEYANSELTKNGHKFETKLLAVKDIPKYAVQKRPEVRRIVPTVAETTSLSSHQFDIPGTAAFTPDVGETVTLTPFGEPVKNDETSFGTHVGSFWKTLESCPFTAPML